MSQQSCRGAAALTIARVPSATDRIPNTPVSQPGDLPTGIATSWSLLKRPSRAFLQYLRVERNASDLTIKSYREDFAALGEYLAANRRRRLLARRHVTTLELRGYIAALHDAGYAKTTIARRLASLRSFFRFGQREGWAEANPAKPLRNPRKDRVAAALSFVATTSTGCSPRRPASEPMGLRDRAILETLYSAGLRVSELAGLNDGRPRFRRRAACACAARDAASGWRRSARTPSGRCRPG